MAKLYPTLSAMLSDGSLPIRGGCWVDVYNHSSNPEIAGTIHTRISHGNYWYVTELEDSAGDPQGVRGD